MIHHSLGAPSGKSQFDRDALSCQVLIPADTTTPCPRGGFPRLGLRNESSVQIIFRTQHTGIAWLTNRVSQERPRPPLRRHAAIDCQANSRPISRSCAELVGNLSCSRGKIGHEQISHMILRRPFLYDGPGIRHFHSLPTSRIVSLPPSLLSHHLWYSTGTHLLALPYPT